MRLWQAILAAMVLATATQTASACGYGMPSPTARFALAETVLVGKVIAFEARSLKLRLDGAGEPVPHSVAVLKVVSMLKGDDRLTHLRVAFLRHQVMAPGFEGIFHLNAHAQEPVHVPSSQMYDYPIAQAGNPAFQTQVDQFRRFGQLLRDPEASLQSKNADDRFLTAALLLTQYRTFNPTVHDKADRFEPIDARTSKLILRVLAETDWNRAAADFRLTPWRLFNMLDVKPADGLNLATIADQKQRFDTARQWLKDNEDKFRVKTFAKRGV